MFAFWLSFSPFKVETPILFLIGDKDLRVPPTQIKEYVRILKARQVDAR